MIVGREVEEKRSKRETQHTILKEGKLYGRSFTQVYKKCFSVLANVIFQLIDIYYINICP